MRPTIGDWLLLTTAVIVIGVAAWVMWAPLHVTPMRLPPANTIVIIPAPTDSEPSPLPEPSPTPAAKG